MNTDFLESLEKNLRRMDEDGLRKGERMLTSPQGAHVSIPMPSMDGERWVLNFCANNYLGLANHPELVAAAHRALDRWGCGVASVRFICGTQRIHRELEVAPERVSRDRRTRFFTPSRSTRGRRMMGLRG